MRDMGEGGKEWNFLSESSLNVFRDFVPDHPSFSVLKNKSSLLF